MSDLPRMAGRYEIHRLLGRGGMASVHLARHPALDREVALKELHSDHVADSDFVIASDVHLQTHHARFVRCCPDFAGRSRRTAVGA